MGRVACDGVVLACFAHERSFADTYVYSFKLQRNMTYMNIIVKPLSIIVFYKRKIRRFKLREKGREELDYV